MSDQDAWTSTLAIPVIGLLAWLVWRLLDSGKNRFNNESPADKKFTSSHRQFSHQDFRDTWPLYPESLQVQPPEIRATPGRVKPEIDNSPRLSKSNQSSSFLGNRWLFVRGYFKRNGTYVSGYFKGAFSNFWYSYKLTRSTFKERLSVKPSTASRPHISSNHSIADAHQLFRPAHFDVGYQVSSNSESLSASRGNDFEIAERSKVEPVVPVSSVKANFQPQPHVKKLSVPTYWSGQTIVKGHIRKNGTYVAAHTRRKFGSTAWKATRRK